MAMNGINVEQIAPASVLTVNPQSGLSSVTGLVPAFKGVPWNELSSVYLIRNSKLNLCKIGISEDVPRRLKDLQRDSAYDLELVCEWKCPKIAARAFEALLHEKLSYCRSHGEWFAIDAEDLSAIDGLDIWNIPMIRVKHTRGAVVS